MGYSKKELKLRIKYIKKTLKFIRKTRRWKCNISTKLYLEVETKLVQDLAYYEDQLKQLRSE